MGYSRLISISGGMNSSMEIKLVSPFELKPAEYNPRQMTEDEYKGLKASIKEFGLVEPLVVNNFKDRENVVIGGHQRLKIAVEIGIKEIPVVYVTLDPDKERELNLRLNKNLGEWDYDLLANFDEELLELVGFNANDVFGEREEKPDKEAKSVTCPNCGEEFKA